MPDQTLTKTSAKPVHGTSGRHKRLVGQTRYPTTDKLPLDAEWRMTSAVRFATHIGAPVQTMLTINAAHLQRIGSGGIFDIGNLWDGYRDVLELLRKWVTGRGLPWSCVWAREYTGGRNDHHGEHWHIALHLPPRHRAALSAQVAVWTGEAVGEHDGKTKCIARSKMGAWYLSISKDNAGEYLGKATPRTRLRYGRSVPNHQRQGGKGGGEGIIEGKRFGISKTLGATAQARAGYV